MHFGRKLAAGQFWPCFARPKSVEGDQMRSVSKNMRCCKKQIRPQFSKYRFHTESASSHRLWAYADSLHICFLQHRNLVDFFWKRGSTSATRYSAFNTPTPLCYTYSEPSGREDSPGSIWNIPYQFKKMSRLRLSDPFFGLFLVISEARSQIYIANLVIFKIWVFSATFWHEITLYAIDIDKKRFRTPFLTL